MNILASTLSQCQKMKGNATMSICLLYCVVVQRMLDVLVKCDLFLMYYPKSVTLVIFKYLNMHE